jgi:hypothetical protein
MVLCCKCGAVLHEGDGDRSEATHGYCPACWKIIDAELTEMEKE